MDLIIYLTYFISIKVAVPGRSPPDVAHPDVAPPDVPPPLDLARRTWTARPGPLDLARRTWPTGFLVEFFVIQFSVR